MADEAIISNETTLLRLIAENCPDVICLLGLDRTLRYVSPSAHSVLGWTPEEMMSMSPFALVFPEDIPVIITAIERNLALGVVPTPITVRSRKKDGSMIWLEVAARIARDAANQPLEIVLTMRDVSQWKLLEERLSILALTDGLTGLGNRRALDEALEREWSRTVQDGSQMSLLLLDLDHFKKFNDTYGHQVGDDCLRVIAIAVQESVRSTDIVARYGGEEIAVILPAAGSAGALRIGEKIRASIQALKLSHDGNRDGGYLVTASVGSATAVARCGGTAKMPQGLLQAADGALYKAKHGGRNQVASALVFASTGLRPAGQS